MPFFYLAKDKIDLWAARLAEEYAVYFPAIRENCVHFQRFDAKFLDRGRDATSCRLPPVWALERIRAVEPVKSFLFAARETVASFPSSEPPPGKQRRQIIIGAKNCDMMPLQVHQKLFLEREHIDPFYQQRLANTIIVSADCPVPESTCLCNLLGLPPYVESGSDINLTAFEDGYLVEPISAVGRDLVFGRDKPFRPATEDEVETRDRLRRQAVAALKEINPKPWRKDLADVVDQAKDEKFWREAARDCVECYGCLMTCPTCFCYLLYDQAGKEPQMHANERESGGKEPQVNASKRNPGEPLVSFDRVKIWDACYYEGYARVGGGANARPKMWERFRNRFHCKWMNCTRDWGLHSCSGCGRCYAVCMGKIDIRKILGAM